MQRKNLDVIIHDASTDQWLEFTNPLQVFEIFDIKELIPALEEVDSQVNQCNRFAAGFLSYEAAPAFDPVLKTHNLQDFPLMCFGVFDRPRVVQLPLIADQKNEKLLWRPDTDRHNYDDDIRAIKYLIRQGWTYQVNYTFRMHAQARVQPMELFRQMVQSRQARYGAYIDTDKYAICSASPELFFNLEGNTITCMPMKGTAPRGKTLPEDESIRLNLQNSQKDCAENVMIVDMIRNDLSKVCEYGSVKTPELFRIEKYSTIWQMVSRVRGKKNAGLSDIFSALFPCASITGAPKVKTMSIIRDLEKSPRKIYTGTIGFLQPKRRAQFNVSIRTILIDKEKDILEYGVGSGIVWDSTAENEYQECLLKSKILNAVYPEFELFETMRVDDDQEIFLLDYHLKRLQNSAFYFDYLFDHNAIQARLDHFLKKMDDSKRILRLLLNEKGKIKIESQSLPKITENSIVNIRLAKFPVDKEDIFLYHKTTSRDVYEQAKRDFPECDDVVLWNDDNDITESTIANIVIKENDFYYTPPVNCGLLNGTYRQWLIDNGKLNEKVITVEHLRNCSEIYLINSVREWQRAVLNSD